MATIYDVAKAAGVSPKTVSRVLNGDAPVGAKTRAAVQEAMATLGYVPSRAARSMRSNKSGLVGLITGALSHKLEPIEPTGLPDLFIVQGIQQVMARSAKTLMIADTGGQSDTVPHLIQTFVQHRVEGLIYVADYHRPVTLDTRAATCPVMLVNCYDDGATPAVLPDDEQLQFDLVARLAAAGHRRIAYLTLDTQMVATQLRTVGYRAALEAAGLAFDPDLVVMGRDHVNDEDGARLTEGLNRLLALDAPPTVICCGNDEMALRVYGLLRSRGVRVPEDMSVAGFDNYRTIAETLYPPLTTVDLPYHTMGRLAAERLLARIDGAAPPEDGPNRVGGAVHWRASVRPRLSVTQTQNTDGRTS